MSDINFVNVDVEQIINGLINGFETEFGTTFAPGNEKRYFLLCFAPILISIMNTINDTGKQNLLRYARGEVLDAIGGEMVQRLAALKSSTILKYTLSAAQAGAITIPKGSRATSDGILYFETLADLIIAAGQTTGTVTASAVEAGSKFNGFTAGQIKNIVNPIAYIASVENTTISTGGSDIETDDAYRERIRQSYQSYSTAGPEGAYRFWAMSADSTISDVSVSSPSAGVVKIIPLCSGGAIPGQTILDKVLAAASASNRRPLTDNVQVVAPTAQSYNITFTYYISTAKKTDEANIKAAIESTGGAVDQYKAWQCEKLGRPVNPDELRMRVMNAGASRMVITAPTYSTLTADKVAAVGTVTVTYGGME